MSDRIRKELNSSFFLWALFAYITNPQCVKKGSVKAVQRGSSSFNLTATASKAKNIHTKKEKQFQHSLKKFDVKPQTPSILVLIFLLVFNKWISE